MGETHRAKEQRETEGRYNPWLIFTKLVASRYIRLIRCHICPRKVSAERCMVTVAFAMPTIPVLSVSLSVKFWKTETAAGR